MTPRLRLRSPLLACALVLVLAGCGGNENTLAPHSHAESSITTLFWVVFGFSCFGFSVVCVLLFLGWWRRNTPTLPGGGGEKAATRIVIGAGVALPIALLCALFFYGDLVVTKATGAPSTTGTRMTVRVIGHQFWWEVRYPGTSVVTANEIHIPVNTRVKVLTSTADVIHSLWVPELNRKLDMIPGQTGAVLLDANRPGVYAGHCSEFCGLQHAHMVVLVFAQPRAAFERWLSHNSKPAAAASGTGAQAFMRDGCGDCHQVRGTSAHGDVGPDLTHFATRTTIAAARVPNDPAHLAEWIRYPQKLKPGSKMPNLDLPQKDWSELQQYVASLR